MMKFTICITKATLGGDFCQADVITDKGYCVQLCLVVSRCVQLRLDLEHPSSDNLGKLSS